MALTSWNDILNKPKGVDNIEEIALEVSDLSASVLSINEDIGEIQLDISDLSASVLSISEDVGEIALDVSQLSASVLSIAGDVEDLQGSEVTITGTFASTAGDVTKNYPTGFSYQNCTAVGFMVEISGTRWDTIPNHNNKNVSISLRDNGIYVFTSDETLFEKNFRFKLIKTN